MIFKVYYQETKVRNPKREQTQCLYLEAENEVTARIKIEDNTPYNIEFIQELDGNHLEYEKQHVNFEISEFN